MSAAAAAVPTAAWRLGSTLAWRWLPEAWARRLTSFARSHVGAWVAPAVGLAFGGVGAAGMFPPWQMLTLCAAWIPLVVGTWTLTLDAGLVRSAAGLDMAVYASLGVAFAVLFAFVLGWDVRAVGCFVQTVAPPFIYLFDAAPPGNDELRFRMAALGTVLYTYYLAVIRLGYAGPDEDWVVGTLGGLSLIHI